MLKVSIQILPSLKDFINILFQRKKKDKVFGKNNNLFFYSRSCYALQSICEMRYRKINRPVEVWIPNYFCGETLNPIRNNSHIKLILYPINSNLEPDYNRFSTIRDSVSPDVFLFVHYFGNFLNINDASKFCKKNNALLVEDCAHVLYPNGCFGKTGDCVFFSPHKCFALCDGSVLQINDTGYIDDKDVSFLSDEFKKMNKCNSLYGYVVNIIKSFIGYKAKGTYLPTPHFDIAHKALRATQISSISYYILTKISYSHCKQYTDRRIENLSCIKKYLESKKMPVRCINKIDISSIPYVAVFEITDTNNALAVSKALSDIGLPLGVWTYLPYEIADTEELLPKHLSAYLFTIPIHQKINYKKIGYN